MRCFFVNLLAHSAYEQEVASKALEIESRVVAWRRHFHQNPELSNREFKTASFIAGELKNLGLWLRKQWGELGLWGS